MVHFFDFFGPPALKIAKSEPLTLGQAPKALSQMGSRQVEFFSAKVDSGGRNFEFLDIFEKFQKKFEVPMSEGGATYQRGV